MVYAGAIPPTTQYPAVVFDAFYKDHVNCGTVWRCSPDVTIDVVSRMYTHRAFMVADGMEMSSRFVPAGDAHGLLAFPLLM